MPDPAIAIPNLLYRYAMHFDDGDLLAAARLFDHGSVVVGGTSMWPASRTWKLCVCAPRPSIGPSSAMSEHRLRIRRVAVSDVAVLVQGESGVGKEDRKSLV